ncbi:hypothetical protein QWE_24120, partial [Agrobacterium albertimagni AOL15]
TDNGDGTTNAGVNSNTFEVTIAVTGVNDTPNDNRSNAVSVATAEDTGIADLTSLMRTTFGGSQNPYNFVDQDDDTNDLGGTPAQMTLSVAHGTLTFTDGSGLTVVSGNGTGAIVVQGSVSDLNSFINGGGAANVSYQPNTNFFGQDTLSFQISDQGDQGMAAKLSQVRTATINVSPVNDAPMSTDDSVTTDEDTAKILSVNDFGTYSDVEGSALAAVKITSLASNGTLQYFNGSNWINVTLNQEVSAADINGNKLRFVPDANESGNPYATIGFRVGDGAAFSENAYTLTVNVTEIPDDKVVYREISAQDTLSYSGEATTFQLSSPGTPSGPATLTIRGSGDYSQGNSDEYIDAWVRNGSGWTYIGRYGPSEGNVTVVPGGSADNRTWSVDVSLTAAQLLSATIAGKVIVHLDNSGDVNPGRGGADTFGVTLKANFIVSAADPIILDLDRDGFAFSSIDNGVTFDIDADGKADQIAWTKDDGILAYDIDGNGLIDNGSEIFTPDFNGGKFASGVAALASLDTNGDGVIDANDDAFSKLKIWVDANNNGISDEGELSSLFDNGVTSISLTTDNTGGQEDGQTVFSKGTFTFADGSTGDFMEVGFDTIFGSDADPLTVMGTDGDDILHGGMGQVVMTGGAGNDTFVFDGTALDELDVADVITDFNGDGDVLDVTALLDSLLGEQASAETAAS